MAEETQQEEQEKFVIFTGERYMRTLHRDAQLLGWLALVRVVTCGQVARFLFDGDAEAAYKELEHMRAKRWIGRCDDVRLPKGCGAARGPARVYFLTKIGQQVLAKVNVDLAAIADAGRPEGAKLNRVPHELAIAESYLWWKEQGYVILEFVPEARVRSIMMQVSRQEGTSIDKERLGNALGDYHAVVLADESVELKERLRFRECEIAIGYNAKQIRSKPKDMMWFACEQSQADSVVVNAGVKPMMLGNMCEPRPKIEGGTARNEGDFIVVEVKEKIGAGDGGVDRRSTARILECLDVLGGIATAEGIRAITGTVRSYVSKTLARAEREGLLKSYEVSVMPGKKTGRSNRLYMRADHEEVTAHERIHRALVSRTVAHQVQYRRIIKRYDIAPGIVIFLQGGAVDSPTYVCAVDDPRLSVEDFNRLLEEAKEVYLGDNNMYTAALVHPERIESLRALNQEIAVWDVSSSLRAGQKKSKRRRKRTQKVLPYDAESVPTPAVSSVTKTLATT